MGILAHRLVKNRLPQRTGASCTATLGGCTVAMLLWLITENWHLRTEGMKGRRH